MISMKEIEQCDFVAATPIIVNKKKIKFGDSTFVPAEKNLIVLKKNRGRK